MIGVLALQGDFEAHSKMMRDLGAHVREVRVPSDLDGLDGLVIPGGESTTMTLGIKREGLGDPLRAFVATGKPVLGTCAGMIMLDREHLGSMDTLCRRNAFGRQIRSFEEDLEIPGIDGTVRAVFIRAPWLAEYGDAMIRSIPSPLSRSPSPRACSQPRSERWSPSSGSACPLRSATFKSDSPWRVK